MKTCKTCCLAKEIAQFPTCKNAKGGVRVRRQCKTCFNKACAERPGWKARKIAQTARRMEKHKVLRDQHSYPHMARRLLNDCKKSDKNKGRTCDLVFDFVLEHIQKPCAYCEDDQSPRTLDRMNSALGHTQDNVLPACGVCNSIKSDMPYEAWLHVMVGVKVARQNGAFGPWKGLHNPKRSKTVALEEG